MEKHAWKVPHIRGTKNGSVQLSVFRLDKKADFEKNLGGCYYKPSYIKRKKKFFKLLFAKTPFLGLNRGLIFFGVLNFR